MFLLIYILRWKYSKMKSGLEKWPKEKVPENLSFRSLVA